MNLRHPGPSPLNADVTLTDQTGRVFRAGLWKSPTGTAISWPKLAQGTYTFAVRHLASAEPIIEVKHVTIRPGANADERISNLEIRDAAKLSIELLSTNGQPLGLTERDATLFLRHRQRRSEWEGRVVRIRGSQLEIMTTTGPTDIRVCVPGFVSTEAYGVGGSARIELEPAASVDVHLHSGPSEKLSGQYVGRLSARPRRGESAAIPGWPPTAFDLDGVTRWKDLDPAGPVTLSAPAFGTLFVEVRRRHGTPAWNPPSFLSVPGLEPVKVSLDRGGNKPDVVHIRLPE